MSPGDRLARCAGCMEERYVYGGAPCCEFGGRVGVGVQSNSFCVYHDMSRGDKPVFGVVERGAGTLIGNDLDY